MLLFKDIQDKFGSFCNYIWAFTDNKTIIMKAILMEIYPAKKWLVHAD